MLDKFKKIKKGFTLTEIALVLSIAAIAGFIAFSQMVKQEELNKAGMAGSQIKLIGDSVNAYISNHYDTLSSLTNSTGTSSDLGPRTCTTSTNSCSITVATLVNEGLLPSTYSGKNVYGSSYNIVLKRNGTSPYYKINGMVTTSSALITGSNIRYDLLGQAMQKAGIDSGMTRGTSTTVSGYNGAWTATSTDYSNINLAGILAYQAGYGTYNYSVFLRRDGTLPMTGNLNMGTNSINNAVDYNGSGNINTGGRITAGNEITAKNGYGDSITLGGDSSAGGLGPDYELRMGSNKPLTIHSPNASRGNDIILDIDGNARVQTKLATNGYNPNDIPNGWGGGLRTFDVVASGTVALIKNGTSPTSGNLAAYMNLNGDIYSSNSINTAGTMNASGNITGNGLYGNYVHSNGNIDANNDMNVGHQVNAQYVWASGNLNSNYVHSNGNIDANGRINSGEFVYINGQGGVGGGCSPNGLIGRTSSGQVISCVNGVWRSPVSTSIYYNTAQSTAYRFPNTAAYCNGSDVAVGGGGYCSSRSGYIWITGSYPVGTNGWFVACDQNKSDDGNSTVTTFVKCQASN